ncbi:hypothetical protein P20480_1333 [Pseudoalteromonas sp. BSi20480]|nr:hypothetical protein P20480_1333 [Pseudoalteromonas sp. BSi20480]
MTSPKKVFILQPALVALWLNASKINCLAVIQSWPLSSVG